MIKTTFNEIYRGIVKDNTGERGRCKIFIPGVYPYEFINDPKTLPWAEPAMPLIGGSFTAVNADPEMDQFFPIRLILYENDQYELVEDLYSVDNYHWFPKAQLLGLSLLLDRDLVL